METTTKARSAGKAGVGRRALAAAVAVAIGLSLGGSTTTEAREPSKADMAEAQRRFQEATELYEQDNNLAGALAEFRRAYNLAPNYKVLYNIGQLCYLLQDYPCALNSFSRYLREGGAEVPGTRREEVSRDVSRLQGRVAKLRIVSNRPGAEVVVDNVRVGRTPLDAPVMVGAGRPQVRVTLAGHAPFTRVVEVASMETATVEVELVPMGESTAAGGLTSETSGLELSASERRRDRKSSASAPLAPWLITGALALGAGTTGAMALWSASDLKKRREQFGVSNPDELAEKGTRTKRLALASDILLGATAVSAAISAYLTFREPSDNDNVALIVGPAAVGLSGRF